MYVTATVLAEVEQRGWVGPGLTGFVVIVGLIVATVLLWRNMNKQLKRVRFDQGPDEGAAAERDVGPGGPGERRSDDEQPPGGEQGSAAERDADGDLGTTGRPG